MQTAPAVCHTPPVPVPPTPPPYPKLLHCFAYERYGYYYKRIHLPYDLPQVYATPPTYYHFRNTVSDEPTTVEMYVDLSGHIAADAFRLDVGFKSIISPYWTHWHYDNEKSTEAPFFATTWYKKTLPPAYLNHRVAFMIVDSGWFPPPPKGFSPFHPNVLPY